MAKKGAGSQSETGDGTTGEWVSVLNSEPLWWYALLSLDTCSLIFQQRVLTKTTVVSESLGGFVRCH